MRRFALLCLVLFLAAAGAFFGAGRCGRDESTGAWGAIVVVSCSGAIIGYCRHLASAAGALVLLVGLPILSITLGYVGAFFVWEQTGLSATFGVMSAVLLTSLVISENSGVKYRWRAAVIGLTTAGIGLVASHRPSQPAWLPVSLVTGLLLLLAAAKPNRVFRRPGSPGRCLLSADLCHNMGMPMNAEAFRLPEETAQSEIRLRTAPDVGAAERVETAERPPEQERVLAETDRLDVGLDLRRYPEFLERLADTGEHFQDSVTMARIIEAVYGDLREQLQLTEESPKKMMRAAVLHDIGKSGPAGERGPVNAAVRRLFEPPVRPFNPFIDGRSKTVRDFLTEQSYEDAAAIEAALATAGIEAAAEPMIEFWRRHAQWTYDILAAAPTDVADSETVLIASTHHLFENKNPANLDLESVPAEAPVLEVIEMSELLAAVDKYQAFRDRGGLDHAAAAQRLTVFFNAHPPELPASLRAKYLAVIEVLDRNEEALAAILG